MSPTGEAKQYLEVVSKENELTVDEMILAVLVEISEKLDKIPTELKPMARAILSA